MVSNNNILVLVVVLLPIIVPIFSLVISRKYQNITLLVFYGYVLNFILNLYMFYNLLKYEYMKYKIVIFLQESIEKNISISLSVDLVSSFVILVIFAISIGLMNFFYNESQQNLLFDKICVCIYIFFSFIIVLYATFTFTEQKVGCKCKNCDLICFVIKIFRWLFN